MYKEKKKTADRIKRKVNETHYEIGTFVHKFLSKLYKKQEGKDTNLSFFNEQKFWAETSNLRIYNDQ